MTEEKSSLWDSIKQEALFRLLWLIGTGLAATVRIRTDGWEKLEKLVSDGNGGLVLPWHGVTMLPIYRCRHMGFYAMVSLSRDGGLQDKMLKSRGFKTVRGSKARQGARALLESIRAIKAGGVIANAADGAKGPSRIVQEGQVYLAQKSGCPVLPVGVACKPCKRLASWDAMMIPAPFARAVIAFGDPLSISQDEDPQAAAKRIEDAINAAEQRAIEVLG